uniref:Cilia- and flagella-associated protein 58-like n=1 Tax=Myripristis murdjan TaxID=586833 RepID=A0A667ZWF0_9TELE
LYPHTRSTLCMHTHSALRSMERESELALSELARDERMDHIRVHIEKVTHALRKSHNNENRLMARCKQLNAKIASISAKAHTDNRRAELTQTELKSVKGDLDKTWKKLYDTEDLAESRRTVILELEEKLTSQAKMHEDQASISTSLTHKTLTKVTSERDELYVKVHTLEENLLAAKAEMQSQRETDGKKIIKLQQECQAAWDSIKNSQQPMEINTLKREVKRLHSDLEASKMGAEAQILECQSAKESQQKTEQELNKKKLLIDQIIQQLGQEQLNHTKLQKESKQLSQAHKKLSSENQEITKELETKKDRIKKMRLELKTLNKKNMDIQKQLHQMKNEQENITNLKAKIKTLEVKLEASHIEEETGRKSLDAVIKEKDSLTRHIIKVEQENEEQESLIKLQKQEKSSMEQQIHKYHQQAKSQEETIKQLENDCACYVNEKNSLKKQMQLLQNKLASTGVDITVLKDRITGRENETQKCEKEFLSVNLANLELQKDLAERNERIKTMTLELESKDKCLANLWHRDDQWMSAPDEAEEKCLELTEENTKLKKELCLLRKKIEQLNKDIISHKTNEQILHKINVDDDAEKAQLQKKVDQISRERYLLGKQLLHRNDERTLLHQKVKILQSLLTKGQNHYNQRVDEILLLKMEIKRLYGETSKSSRDISNLKANLLETQKLLFYERKQAPYLRKMNDLPVALMHQWRLDASKFKLVQKIRLLQKQLITKTQEVADLMLSLQEKEKSYEELEKKMARRPGPEVAMQLQQSKWKIRDLEEKCKALTAQVRMYYSDREKHKVETFKLINERDNMKRNYFAEKQCNRVQLAKAKDQLPPLKLPMINNKPRFTGGGFKVSSPSRPNPNSKDLPTLFPVNVKSLTRT